MPMPTELSLATVWAARAGDPAAWEALCAHFAGRVRRLARHYGWPGATPDDLEQEAWIGLIRAVRTFDPARGADFARFAEYAIRRQLQTACKQAFRQKHLPFLTALRLEQPLGSAPDAGRTLGDRVPAPATGQPEAALEPDPLEQALTAALRAPLTATERQIFWAWAAGLPYAAIAQRLGRPRKAVDNALQRALRKIRAAAGADGISRVPASRR